MTTRTSLFTTVFSFLVGAIATSQALAAAEPPITPGDTIVVLHDTHSQAGTEKLAPVESGTELVATQTKGDWVAVTVERDGKEISGWIHRRDFISDPRMAFARLTVRFPANVDRAEEDFGAWDRNRDREPWTSPCSTSS